MAPECQLQMCVCTLSDQWIYHIAFLDQLNRILVLLRLVRNRVDKYNISTKKKKKEVHGFKYNISYNNWVNWGI